jgi:hypothetical protein
MRTLLATTGLAILVSLCTAAAASSEPTAAAASPVFRAGRLAACILYYHPKRLVCTRRGKPSTLSMRPTGTARTGELELKEPVSLIAFRPLLVGQTWSEGRDFRCRHRRSGLTCRNASGHGWWLGRPSAYRLF